MKQFITVFSAVLFFHLAAAQYFQGSAAKDASNVTNLKIAFKMKPTGNITTAISYIEAAFRYPTASTPSFTITDITSNTAVFPGLDMKRLTPDYIANGYTYVKFVFNTGTIQTAQYASGNEYPLFTITTSLPATAMPNFDMISNLVLAQYQFGVVDGGGNLLDPGTGPQLYGPGFYIMGNDHILPMIDRTVPVQFGSFTVNKTEKGALLTWRVENQDAGTSRFEVQRGLNGIDFVTLQTIGVDSTAGARATYSFRDVNTGSMGSAAMLYYRIKQIDKDGRFVYTEVRSFSLNSKSLGIRLYPNPALENIQLSLDLHAATTVNINIVDANGKLVKQLDFSGVPGSNREHIDVSKLSKGMYQVVIKAGEITETVKLLKN